MKASPMALDSCDANVFFCMVHDVYDNSCGDVWFVNSEKALFLV
jgi:hypothetical protein